MRGGERECRKEDAQKRLEPAHEQAEIVTGSGEDGIDAIAFAALEVIASHPVFSFDMADDRLDGGTSFHLATKGYLAADPDAELVWVVVAPVALVDVNTLGGDPGERSMSAPTGPRV